MIWTNEANSSSVSKKSKLSLSLGSLEKFGSSNDNNSTRIWSNQILHPNQITNSSVDVEPDDNLDDFESPQKFDATPKKVKRKDVRPYRRPGDNSCTQDIIVAAYKKAKEDNMEYRSEDEFVIFQKIKQSRQGKQILDKCGSADKEKEKNDNSSHNPAEDKFAEPFLPLITIKQTNKINIKCNSNKNLRKELKNIKINDVIIPDSEDEVIPCSQKVVRAKSLKTVNDHNVKVETLARMENKNEDSKSFTRTGIFWSGNLSIRLLYSEQETDKGTVYCIPKQNCVPLPVLVSHQDTANILNIDHCEALKDKVLKEDNISVDPNSNNVIQPENKQFPNLESSMSLHNDLGSNEKCKNVDSALEKSNAQTSESRRSLIVGKTFQLAWDEIEMTEETLDLKPSQSNVSEFKKISKGLKKSKVRKNVETKGLKSSSRVLTLNKCRSKKLQCTYVRKLWWRSKYLKRRYRLSKVGMTRSGVKFRN